MSEDGKIKVDNRIYAQPGWYEILELVGINNRDTTHPRLGAIIRTEDHRYLSIYRPFFDLLVGLSDTMQVNIPPSPLDKPTILIPKQLVERVIFHIFEHIPGVLFQDGGYDQTYRAPSENISLYR